MSLLLAVDVRQNVSADQSRDTEYYHHTQNCKYDPHAQYLTPLPFDWWAASPATTHQPGRRRTAEPPLTFVKGPTRAAQHTSHDVIKFSLYMLCTLLS